MMKILGSGAKLDCGKCVFTHEKETDFIKDHQFGGEWKRMKNKGTAQAP